MTRHAPPILALAGGPGCGKSTLASELATEIPAVAVIHLDECYHNDPHLAPSVPAYGRPGKNVNFSDPCSIDPDRVTQAINRHQGADLIIVEGIFALALPHVRGRARWTVYIDAPADIRLARKTLRKIHEGYDPRHVLRGYLEHGRDAHDQHIAPSRAHADLILDGNAAVPDLVKQIRILIRN